MILLIDNHDSFTHNLVQALGLAGADVRRLRVVRNDACPLEDLLVERPSHVVLSPGPGHPRDAGLSLSILDACAEVPLLGVCLGHQAIAWQAGARVARSPRPTHGSAVAVVHAATGLFAGLASPFEAALYHSLRVEEDGLPPCLSVTARSGPGDIMGLRHVERPHYGVQFHPESFLTPDGIRLLRNFLDL